MGKHRIRGSNSPDPKQCAHKGHTKEPTADDRGGFLRKCKSCETEWWTPD